MFPNAIRNLATSIVLSVASGILSAPAAAAATVIVTTAAELEAALVPANSGAQIFVVEGEYDVSTPLTVPDGAILAGEGVMGFDGSGLPTGIAPSGRTVLRAKATLAGDILTLGNGSTVRNLVIEDVVGRQVAGNPVTMVSRVAGDFISATIAQCEIINPNPALTSPERSSGRAVAVITRNLNLGLDPPPHEGAVLHLKMTQSIVRSPGGGDGVFAINFASDSQIGLDLEGNVIGGALGATGGVARPDAVTGAGVLYFKPHAAGFSGVFFSAASRNACRFAPYHGAGFSGDRGLGTSFTFAALPIEPRMMMSAISPAAASEL